MKETNNHGGKREGAGRPATGTTRTLSLTLPDEIWAFVDARKEKWGVSQSMTLRKMLEEYYYPDADCDYCNGKGEIQEGFVYMKCPKCQ